MLTTEVYTDYQRGERDSRAPNIRPVTKKLQQHVPFFFPTFFFCLKKLEEKMINKYVLDKHGGECVCVCVNLTLV